MFFYGRTSNSLYRKTQIKIIRGFSALAHQNEEKLYLDARGNRKINKK